MYDSFSTDYDRFVNWPGRLAVEMPFLERQVQAVSTAGQQTRVLDAACGTGMHAIELARRGYAAAGADLSVGMVTRAQANAAAAGVDVHFATAGFTELASTFSRQFPEKSRVLFPFDAVICLGNSLPHLLTAQELAAGLADFASCLRPGGLLLIQNRNFDAVLDRQERWMEPQSHRSGDTEWVFQRFYDFLPGGLLGFNIVTLRRKDGEGWQQQVTSGQLYPLRQAELTTALQSSNFYEITPYGSMAGEPFTPQTSPNLVIVARAKIIF
jgi:glycine/sarcosine N-methyltransferase